MMRKDTRRESKLTRKTPFSREIVIHVFVDGNFQFQKSFTEGPILVGRQPEADLVLNQTYVSRNHFRIEESQDSVFRVINLNSQNGVLIDGAFVEQALVSDHMKINIEGVDLQVSLGRVLPRRKAVDHDEETQPPRPLSSIMGKKRS